MTTGIFLGLRLLECPQNLVPGRDGIRQALQSRCDLLVLVVAKVAGPRARRENEVIVRNRHLFPIGRVDEDGLAIHVHPRHFSKDDRGIELPPEDLADRRSDLPGGEDGRRHLVQQRLKQVVIRAIDQEDTRLCLPQRLGGPETPKASPHDDDPGNAIIHGFPDLSHPSAAVRRPLAEREDAPAGPSVARPIGATRSRAKGLPAVSRLAESEKTDTIDLRAIRRRGS